jgi:hypothetical protein
LCQIRRQPGASPLPRKHARTIASPVGCYLLLVLHVPVNVKSLVELGKRYPWPRPPRCLSCGSPRIWGHGYVRRYFEGFIHPLWVKRLRCPDCRTVYTLRPDLFYRGFLYSVTMILSSLMAKMVDGRWLSSIPRQNQQYWFKGLRLQAQRFETVPFPDMDTLQEIIARGFIPVSHSLDCAMLRL